MKTIKALTRMKNFKKNLLLLIAIFPVIILLSSVFAEKAMTLDCSPPFKVGSPCAPNGVCGDPSLVLCVESQMCVKNYSDCETLNPTATPTPTPACDYNSNPDRCGSITHWCNNGTCTDCTIGFLNCDGTRGCETQGSSCPTPTSVQIPTCFDDCMARPGKSETQCDKECGLPTPTPTIPQTACQLAGGSCIPLGGSCAPGSVATSLNCGDLGICCQISTSPTPQTLKWVKLVFCPAPTSPPATPTANCGNETCSSNQTCVGSPADTSTFCLTKGVGNPTSYCGKPNKTPNNDACSSGVCDSTTLLCVGQPVVPTKTPTIPTATPIPVTIITPTKTPPAPTSTPTPNLTAQCSNKNTDLPTTYFDYQCSPSCDGDWKATVTQNFNCSPPDNICCYKAKPGFSITTSSPGGPSPGVSSDTILDLSLNLEGISVEKDQNGNFKGNPNPKTPARTTTVEIINASNQSVRTETASLNFASSTGMFKGTVNLGRLSGGNYLVKIKSERYLKRLLPGIITSGTTSPVTLTLLAGDMNGDNAIDVRDYNILAACLDTSRPMSDPNSKFQSAGCQTFRTQGVTIENVDLNDDGNIDLLGDFNMLFKNMSRHEGD